VTGRQGPWNIGLLSVRTGSGPNDVACETLENPSDPNAPTPPTDPREPGGLDTCDSNWLSVGRVSLNVLEESSVGVIATVGDPQTNDNNALIGGDLNYRKSDVWGNRVVEGSLWFQRTFSTGAHSDEDALGLTLGYPNDRVNWRFRYRQFGENYNPTLGFANRIDISRWDTEFGYRWRPETWLRTIDTGFDGLFVTEQHSRDLESGTFKVRIIEFENQPGDQLDFAWTWRQEDLDAPFEIQPGVVIEQGNYTFQRSSFVLETANQRKLSGKLEMSWGSFFKGTRLQTEARLTWRPSSALLLEGTWTQNDIELDELDTTLGDKEDTDFTTRIVTARVNISFNTHWFWDNFAQYDNQTDEIRVNSRLRWLVEDGKELFLIFNPTYRAEHQHVSSTSSESFFKVRWTFRY
jgi:hypothetical protein